MEKYAEEYEHAAPQNPRTQYLPISGDGDIDTPDGAESPNSVDSLDKKLDGINSATMQYDPHSVFSFDDEGCGGGCIKSANHVPDLDVTDVHKTFQALVDGFKPVITAMQQHASETDVDRIAAVYGTSGQGFDVPGILNSVNEVAQSFDDAVVATHDSAGHTLTALRDTVKAERSKLAERADVVHWSAADIAKFAGFSLGPAALMKTFPKIIGGPWTLGAGAAADLALHWYHKRKAQGLGPEEVEAGQQKALAALHESDDAVRAFREEIPKLSAVANGSIANIPVPKPDKAETVSEVENIPADVAEPGPADPGAPGDPGAIAPTPDSPVGDPEKDTPVDGPASTDPFGGMPSGGGGDPMGGMPSGGMPSGGGGDPFSGMPMAQPAEADDPFADMPLDDEMDEGEDGEPETDDEFADTDENGDEDTDDDTDEEEAEKQNDETLGDGDAAVPVNEVAAGGEPVADDPNSPAARTVTMPDGSQVTFPSAHQAHLAQSMIEASGQGNPKSLYQAASEEGYQVPPQGEDIGEKVSPALMKTGDIVSGDAGQGMYIGNGNVLMESGEVKQYSDVSSFDGDNGGIYRLAEPDDAKTGTEGPVQTVSDTSTAAPVAGTETAERPGVPTDTAAAVSQDTSAPGLSSADTGGGAMNPDTAFPN